MPGMLAASCGLPLVAAVLLVSCVACGGTSTGSGTLAGETRSSPMPPAASPPPQTGKGAQSPEDFPPAAQSLSFGGQLTAQVSNGRPNSCGWGTGPTGPEFGFGVYFQDGGAWYLFSLSTDALVQPYRGPGTYSAKAWLERVDPGTGPMVARCEGTVQLVVTADTHPDTGTVSGTVRDGSGRMVTVSGGWTCVPGPSLGPG